MIINGSLLEGLSHNRAPYKYTICQSIQIQRTIPVSRCLWTRDSPSRGELFSSLSLTNCSRYLHTRAPSGNGADHFFKCRWEDLVAMSSCLDALPRRMAAEFRAPPGIIPMCCTALADMRAWSLCSPPMLGGAPRCSRILTRRSRSAREMGRGDVAATSLNT